VVAHGWLLGFGYAIAWLPFAWVKRVAFLYHYLPALLIATLATAVVFHLVAQPVAHTMICRGACRLQRSCSYLYAAALGRCCQLTLFPTSLPRHMPPPEGIDAPHGAARCTMDALLTYATDSSLGQIWDVCWPARRATGAPATMAPRRSIWDSPLPNGTSLRPHGVHFVLGSKAGP